MTRLTQSLLMLARVEAASERDEAEVVDVTLAGGGGRRAPSRRPKGVELAAELEPDLVAEGEPVLLRQVLIGLLTNACKNTPAPGTVTLRGSRGEGGVVRIEVEDTGRGIPAEEQGRVFERFYRGSGALESEGFGLGLSIAKRMVDVMGGEIGLDSDARRAAPPSGCSCASTSRPRPRWPDRPMSPTPPAPAASSSSTTSRRCASRSATRSSRRASTSTLAADGEDAEAKIDDEGVFDLLILDIMMPGKSGLDICREVRSQSAVPIILLTAKDAEVDKVVGLEVGADDYVTKPFSVRELLGRVRAQLRRRELDRSDGVRRARRSRPGPVTIDLARHLVTVRGEPVNLTRSEFQVLRLLAENPGQVFSRKEIMEELWQTEFRGDVRACDVHISNLRQKVESRPAEPRAGADGAPGRLPLRVVALQQAPGDAPDRRLPVGEAGAALGQDREAQLRPLPDPQQRALVDAPPAAARVPAALEVDAEALRRALGDAPALAGGDPAQQAESVGAVALGDQRRQAEEEARLVARRDLAAAPGRGWG